METLGIYVQVPFCSSKCSFCNFSSRVEPPAVFETYCRALEQELECLPRLYERVGIAFPDDVLARPFADTVYFGGGTPSLLGAGRLRRIVSALKHYFQVADHPEFTIEVTPGSADQRFLRAARSLGINRLSIGAQSFDDRELSCVGRLHSAADTSELVCTAHHAGFANLSLDLIAGLPYQTEASWRLSLAQAVSLAPQHLSVYLFEIDEKSRLGGEVLRQGTRYHATVVPGDEFMADAYEMAREFLSNEGYTQYEISNFARPGYESRHNRKYWQLKPYLGLGAGAHSFDGKRRWSNVASEHEYESRLAAGQLPIAEIHVLSLEEQLEEFFFLGLRQRAGVDLNGATERWGSARVSRWEPRISALASAGWIERQDQRIRIAERGYLVSNEIFQEFLS
jgi:oxygen-independent coproporphyrinogen III oxidase